MVSKELSEDELHVLDIIVNLEPLTKHEIQGFRIGEDLTLSTEQLESVLEALSKRGFISVKREQYREVISINEQYKPEITSILTKSWESKKIKREMLIDEVQKNTVQILKLLEFKMTSDGKTKFFFSDYHWDSGSTSLCDRLTELGMLFKQIWSSRKHSYQSYYPRVVPFNVERVLEQSIIQKINLEELEMATDWRILIMATYSKTPLTYEDIRLNLPELTSYEVNEVLYKLQTRGIISKSPTEIRIPEGSREIVKNYFVLNQYQSFKVDVLQKLRKRIGIRLSNLYLLGLVKRILTSIPIQIVSDPFYSIERRELVDFKQEDLIEASKLGLLFPTKNVVIIAHEILPELETALKSAFAEETFMTIPANEIFTAISVWRKIFSQCTDYLKVQDEYVNEETLEILQSYCSQGIKIFIVSSIEGARDLDIDEMKKRVDDMKRMKRNITLVFVGRGPQGIAPFHERYIISKDVCYMISTTIKQVGKFKSASIVSLSKSKKESTIEPAFDFWVHTPIETLKERGIERIGFDEWVSRKSK